MSNLGITAVDHDMVKKLHIITNKREMIPICTIPLITKDLAESHYVTPIS